jgi:hypothetical protein
MIEGLDAVMLGILVAEAKLCKLCLIQLDGNRGKDHRLGTARERKALRILVYKTDDTPRKARSGRFLDSNRIDTESGISFSEEACIGVGRMIFPGISLDENSNDSAEI